MKGTSETAEITLVGAGLAGSLLAIFLAKRGFRVTIYERRADMRLESVEGGRSINLALANRGIRPLEAVGLMDRIRPMMIPMAGRMIHDAHGGLQLLPYGHRPHEVIHSIARGGLNAVLMDAAEATGRVKIHFGHNCRDVDFGSKTMTVVRAHDDNVETVAWDVLIGTDGSASAVRAALLEATSGSLQDEPLGHVYKELSILPTTDGGFQMERGALHIWPRGELMLIALPNTDGSFTVTLFLPSSGMSSVEYLTDAESVREFFEALFPDALALIPHLTDEFFTNPTGNLGTVRCAPWSHQGALLLGDAAHAIVPFHGQGMNCAFEDCMVLDEILAKGDRTWSEVFSEFESARKPNAEAIADMALENYVEMRSTVLHAKFALRKEVAFRLEDLYPEIFIPRYSMVMFHHIPYAEAQRRGTIQKEILDLLTADCERIEDVDFERGGRLIAERLR